jgi:hypothetical protein
MTPPGLDPPAWRGHAETLGGHPFPPPRQLSQRPLGEALREGWKIPADTWLALGPLTTMAALEGLASGSLASAKVWLPARIEGKTVSGWNISSDASSALAVLASAEGVFIVDTSGDFDGRRILLDVEGETPAARWISATTDEKSGTHAFLFDEIAAAALTSPGIFSISEERYAASGIRDDAIRLEPSEKGNIRIVRLSDAAALEPALHSAWEGGIEGHGHLHTAAADPLALMKQFHGHLGPYVVIGYRMGMIALERTGSSGHFEITAEVHSVLRPPRSCLIDGVQLGSGCTLGKRNIAIFDEAGPPFATFTTGDGKEITVRLMPSIPAMIKASIDSIGVEATGAAVWDMDEGSLFEVIAGH